MSLRFCTIVSKNYLARARALSESIKKFHPDARLDVLLVDRIDGCFEPKDESFDITLLEELPIPDLPSFSFQYDILELNTAAKPTYMKVLLARGIEKLVYLDPDTVLFDSLSRLEALLNEHSIILTPHSTHSYENEKRELDLLRAGIFNLGFIAVKNDPNAISLLLWWENRLHQGCRSDMARGYHVDQKWIDLAPAFFGGVHILKEPGYNVATWNFHDHSFAHRQGRWYVGTDTLKFFHFSGYNPFNSSIVSRNQERYTMANIGQLSQLFSDYSQTCMRLGLAITMRWPYAFGTFDNGDSIIPRARRLYLEQILKGVQFGNPFSTKSGSFYQWMIRGGELMKREQLVDLLNIQPGDWKADEIQSAVENLDLYDWFRRANPKPKWNGHPLAFGKALMKFVGNHVLMQWLPPLFAKQHILNQYFITELNRLKNGSQSVS